MEQMRKETKKTRGGKAAAVSKKQKEAYLRRKGSEVMNMLIAEYSYEEDIQVKQEEALRIGEKRGEKRGKREGIILSSKIFQMVKENPGYTDGQIAGKAACTVEEVKAVRKMFSI